MSRYEDAINSYKSTFGYFTPDAVILYNIGECYENLLQMDEACKYYKKTVKINPEMAQAWFGIGSAMEGQQKWFEAVHYIKKANVGSRPTGSIIKQEIEMRIHTDHNGVTVNAVCTLPDGTEV